MAITYIKLTPDRLEDVERLLLPYWQRRWDKPVADAFFRWRFLERADWEAILAYDGARLVGFLDNFFRPCRIGDALLRTRQTADWFCDPGHRPVGVMLMRKIMEQPEPVLVVGGTDATHQLLPRLRWQSLPDLTDYALPTGGGAAIKRLSELFHFRLAAVPGPLGRALSLPMGGRRRAAPPPGAAEVTCLDADEPLPEIVPRAGTHGLSSLLDQSEADWLRLAPDAMGRYVWLVFSLDGRPAGFSLSRLYRAGPLQAARLLHLQAQVPAVALYAWMSAETARYLAQQGAQWVAARFGCPLVDQALAGLGFRRRHACKAFWWHRGEAPPPLPYHLTWVCGDEAVLPYPD